MSRLLNLCAILLAVSLGGVIGSGQLVADCEVKCFEFEAWTDKESASSEDDGELFRRVGGGTCFFVGNADSGMEGVQGMPSVQKYKKIDDEYLVSFCTVICYSDGSNDGRVTCTSSVTCGTEFDIDCYPGCQNPE